MLTLIWTIAIAAGAIGLALHPPAGSDAAGIAAAVVSLVVVAAFAAVQLVRVSEALRRDSDAARTSEAQYRALFDGSPVATLVFDPGSLRILAANAAAERTYAATRAPISSRSRLATSSTRRPSRGSTPPASWRGRANR